MARFAWSVVVWFLAWGASTHAQTGDASFEVKEGYLSASVRELVSNYGWALVWRADEDRVVDFPFAIANESLEGALANLLEAYRGQFVADLFDGNRVVVIDTPPPRVRVVLPGMASEEPPDSELEIDPEAQASVPEVP